MVYAIVNSIRPCATDLRCRPKTLEELIKQIGRGDAPDVFFLCVVRQSVRHGSRGTTLSLSEK